MKIAEEAGMLKKFAHFLEPILSKLFPTVPKDNPSLGFIASNIAANMMGLGSAATPFGLKAMKRMQELNDKKDTATRSMITFLVINTASVTIIPTTVISLRILNKSSNPTEILSASLISSFSSCFIGLLLDRLFYFIWRKKYD